MKRTRQFRIERLEPRTMLAGHGDFNGDGFDDLAIGIVSENIGTIEHAGAVQVIYGTRKGLALIGNQFWTQNSPGVNGIPAQSDAFGAALATGDFNDDGFDDLAIGVTGETVNGFREAGAVNVLYGSKDGLTAANDQLWSQDSPGIDESPAFEDRFGTSLATGDFNRDGFDDLVIGVPLEDVGTILTAGAAHVLYGSASGLRSTGDQLWTQDSPGIDGRAETSDSFARSFAVGDFNHDGFDDLAIGVSSEDIESLAADTAGAVNVIYGSSKGLTSSGDQFWTQESPNVADDSESGDFFGSALAAGDFDGDGFDDLIVGAQLENNFAGAVHLLSGSQNKLVGTGTLIIASSLGFTSAANFNFGQSLATGDFDRDGFADLAIGAPFEDLTMASLGGAVYVVYGSANGINGGAGPQRWIQGAGPSGTLLGAAEPGDIFGSAVAAGDFDGDGRSDLAIGAFGDNPGGVDSAGAVNVLYSFNSGLITVGNQYWHQALLSSSDDNAAEDYFGSALA